MQVIQQQRPEPSPIPGIDHATWVGAADGLTGLSVWRQTLAPGCATPPHRHDCDEVVLCLEGWGEVHAEGATPSRFGADNTVVLPRNETHQIFNVGPMPLVIVGIFGATPVRTLDAEGTPLALPWRT